MSEPGLYRIENFGWSLVWPERGERFSRALAGYGRRRLVYTSTASVIWSTASASARIMTLVLFVLWRSHEILSEVRIILPRHNTWTSSIPPQNSSLSGKIKISWIEFPSPSEETDWKLIIFLIARIVWWGFWSLARWYERYCSSSASWFDKEWSRGSCCNFVSDEECWWSHVCPGARSFGASLHYLFRDERV